MTDAEITILAKFFIHELGQDAAFVSEWLDNEGNFDNEDERDSFIAKVTRRATNG